MPHMVTRLPISDLNQHLTCALCSGYMIDATTVVECLHSFCRSCLLRYLESSGTCPICDTQINKAQLDKCVRTDHTLQDLVYKLVPGLYKSELRRRKDFYLEQCKLAADDASTSKSDTLPNGGMQIFDKHLVELSAFICTPDEIVSFSLESSPKKTPSLESGKNNNTSENQSIETRSSSTSTRQKSGKENGPKTEEFNFKRYFRCPAAVTIGHLKKLLAYKMELTAAHQIEILHSDEPLLDEYTLMDIAYIYTWRRKAPMQLFFNICKYETEDEPMPMLEPEIATPTSTSDTTAPIASTSLSLCQDVKSDLTTTSASELRLTVPSVIAKKPSQFEPKKEILSPEWRPANSTFIKTTTDKSSTTKETPVANSIRSVLLSACRTFASGPAPSKETSMRGKPPLPIETIGPAPISSFNRPMVNNRPQNGFNQQKTIVNGQIMPPLRLTFTTPPCPAAGGTGNGKKKTKNEPSTGMARMKKSSARPLAPLPASVSAALQKIIAPVNTVPPPAPAIIPAVVNKPIIPSASPIAVPINVEMSISTTPLNSPTSDDQQDDEEPSPTIAYQPTAAQSACTQPAKLRLKKSLSHVVQKLSSNALEACSPNKKLKLDDEENGKDEHEIEQETHEQRTAESTLILT